MLQQGKLQEYLRTTVPELSCLTRLAAKQFAHGQSNPTYLLEVGSSTAIHVSVSMPCMNMQCMFMHANVQHAKQYLALSLSDAGCRPMWGDL